MIQNQEAELAENQKYKIQKVNTQRVINMHLIAQTSLDQSSVSSLSQQQKIQIIINIRSIHLQWLNLKKIQNLEVFSKLNILYLQHNNIKKIQNLQLLTNLQYLALNNNQISKIEGINNLKNLTGLNLAYNQIQQVKNSQFPPNIQLLSLKQNPVSFNANYKQIIVKSLKDIDMLDGQKILTQTKFKILGIFPNALQQYSQQMRKFRKRKEQKQNPQLKLFYTQVPMNEQQAYREMRQKTINILDQNQKQLINKQLEQSKNFNEKIKISRKIRDIISNNRLPTIQEQK